MHIKVNDYVEVISGANRLVPDGHHPDGRPKFKAIRAKVLKVDHAAGKVIVEGVNKVYKHVQRSQRNPQGGRLSKEMPIDASNCKVVCEHCSKATRTGARFLDDGSKERYCKSCGAALGQIAPAHVSHAKK